MISKKYRLTEYELRKVLQKKKPFFSYGLIANTFPNKLGYARIGIVFSGKQTPGSVNRNHFRRHIYDLCSAHLEDISLDIVFCLKKGKILDHKKPEYKIELTKDIEFLMKIIRRETPKK